MAKDAYFFSHDSNARNDPKIAAMRGQYGSEGYGWFWMLIEMMREADGYRLDMHSRYVWNAFALQLQCTTDAAQTFIEDCIDVFKLFESDGDYFWSNSLLRRMEHWEAKSEKRRAAANARWGKDANALQMDSKCNAKKRKEKKLKETKEDIIPYGEIVSYLNEKAGTQYKPTGSKTQELIRARWNEGFHLAEFQTVIDKKVSDWKGNDNAIYLRPVTLFGTKFESYLNQPTKSISSMSENYSYKNKTKQQLAIDREIALNRWVEQGGDPSAFVFESIS